MRGGRRPRRGTGAEAPPVEEAAEPVEQSVEPEATPAAGPESDPMVPGPGPEAVTPEGNSTQLSLGVEETEEILISVPLEEQLGEGSGQVAAAAEAAPATGSSTADADQAASDETVAAGLPAETRAEATRAAELPLGSRAKGAGAPAADRSFESDLYAEPLPYAPSAIPPVDDASVRLRLARIHLRTGSLALARSELETLSILDQLDLLGQLDLAEARWRTGEIRGAGDAALAYVSSGGSAVLGYVIAAEGHAFAGRQDEAKRFIDEALDRTVNGVDAFFAGIRPRGAWETIQPVPSADGMAAVEPAIATEMPASVPQPVAEQPAAETAVEPEAAETAVAPEPAPEPVVEPEAAAEPAVEPEPVVETEAEPIITREPAPEPAVEPEAAAETAVAPEPASEPVVEPEAAAPIVESVVEPALGATPSELAATEPVEPWNTEISAGADALSSNDPLMAALHFAMALRMSPDAARPILGAIGDRRDLALDLVRGEAHRALGEQAEAGRAELSVASAIAPEPAEPQAAAGPEAAAEPESAPEPERAAPPEAPPPLAPPEPPKINWGD